MNSIRFFVLSLCCLAGWLVTSVTGCGGGDSQSTRQQFLSMGTAPVGGAFNVVGNAISEVLNEHRGDANWKLQAKGTKGSQENIRRLVRNELQLALSNAAITYFAVRGESGWDQKYEVQSIATLAPNVAMFITTGDSPIKSIADLKGKRVYVGPAGAGFEMFVAPILEEHGVSYDDFTPIYNTQAAAVDMLADGSVAAAFLGGAVPTSSIQQACSTLDIYFIPFEESTRQTLIEKYPFFSPFTIEAGKYADLKQDFLGLNVGSMHLITSASQDEQLVYDLTRIMWEHRQEIADRHPAGNAINEKNVARYSGTDFHPGAIRYYKEIGVWADTAAGNSDTTTASGE